MRGAILPFVIGCVLLLGPWAAPAYAAPRGPTVLLVSHAPILIDGNAGFVMANGVTGGNGSAASPFLIQGWSISAVTAAGVHVRNTDAYFEVLQVDVTGGGSSYTGIWLENVTHGAVAHVNATNSRYGVEVDGSSGVLVRSSFASANTYDGFFAQVSTDVTFDGDNATANGAYGFHFLSTVGGGVSNATASANGLTGAVTRTEMLLEGATNVTVSGCVLPTSPTYGIYFAASPGARAIGNTVVDHLTAVYSDQSRGLYVEGNMLIGNIQGVYTNADNLTLVDNDLVNSTLGVFVSAASGARLVSNRFASPYGTGVELLGSRGDTLLGNAFAGPGLSMEGNLSADFDSHAIAANNTVNGAPLRYYARCSSAALDGVPTGQLFVASCSRVAATNLSIGPTTVAISLASVGNATVAGNLLHDSATGLDLRNASAVWAYHNAFLNDQVPVATDRAETWDAGYPDGGNYWSALTGTDDCSGPAQDVCPDPDGIRDAPFNLSAAGTDRYPLMRPWNAVPFTISPVFNVTPLTGTTATSFAFDASASTDPNAADAGLEARWDFDGDGIWDTGWSSAKTAAHTFSAPGTYTVHLEVRDFRGFTGNATLEVTVAAAGNLAVDTGFLLEVVGVIAVIAVVALVLFIRWRRKGGRLRRLEGLPPAMKPRGP